jgi:transketolase
MSEDTEYEIGKVYQVVEGKDVVVFANGVMVSKAVEAAKQLEQEGISVKVVNVSTIKPLDQKAIIDMAKSCKAVVTAEEHNIIGGLGSAIAEALRLETNLPIEFVGVKDTFGTSAGNYDDLLNYYGLTSQAIADAVKKVLK